MSREVTLVAKCTGINNRVDPKRLIQYDKRTGTTDLAEGVNIDIDNSGQISSRSGQESISTTVSHSLFCDGGDAFVMQDRDAQADAALYLIGADFSLTGIRSGMTKSAMVSFWQHGAKTYYSNGYENGVIEGGISAPWPDGTHYGPDTLREYYSVPVGKHIAVFDGQMLIAKDNVIWISERHEFGKFRKAGNFFQMGTDVRMVRPVPGGIWVSDSEKTGFVPAGDSPLRNAPFLIKSSFPAHEYSANCRLIDLSRTQFQVPGLSAVWSSDAGLFIGTQDGQLINVTEMKLDYPTGGMGATVIDGHNVINSVY